jgi:serine/threonine protein kinase
MTREETSGAVRPAEEGPVPLEEVQKAILTRHPGIDEEIEEAIRTLRKLKQITGSCVPELPAIPRPVDRPPAAEATLAMTRTGGTMDRATPDLARTEADTAPPRADSDLAASVSFGRYQIVRRLGHGAMGAVYLAYDTQLHRHVALKTPFLGGSPETVERFFREARTAAQVRSPHVCPIYDVGQIGEVHYLSMAFIDGEPLSRAIAAGRLNDLARVADVTRKIALGLQKAHEQGIIHRDLKPDNIMIDQDGEPVVMDFGLARHVDGEVQVTMPGRVLGTPAFMSPEQVEGDPDKMGPPTDIYSLGVVLFQMLTGRLPFQGTLAAVLRQIGTTPPAPPSTVNAALVSDPRLERICLKMMAKLPADRFPTMAAVAGALEPLCAPKPERAERVSAWRRFWSWPARVLAALRRPRPAAAVSAESPTIATPVSALSPPERQPAGFRNTPEGSPSSWDFRTGGAQDGHADRESPAAQESLVNLETLPMEPAKASGESDSGSCSQETTQMTMDVSRR